MSQIVQILCCLLLFLSLVVGQATLTNSDAGNNSQVLVFKSATADPSNALRVEVTLTTQESLAQNSKFYAICGVHDVGTILTDLTDPLGFEFESKCMASGTCDTGAGNMMNVTVLKGK